MAKSGIDKYIIPIVLIGGVGVVAYFLLKNHVGVKESLDTLGKGLKDAVDAANSTGDYLGKTFQRASDFDIKSRKKEAEVGAGIMDFFGDIGYNIQQIPNILNKGYDADRANDYKASEPVRRLLNPKKPSRFQSGASTSTSLDDLISGATKGSAFRPYSGTAGRPYDD